MQIKHSMTIMLLTLLLSGCVAAVVLGTAGGLVVYDHRGVVGLEKDARIFHLIHTKIVRDPNFAGSRVSVSCFNQVVLLTGQAPSVAERAMAEKIAKQTAQVARVYNEITVDSPISLKEQAKDTWITGEVRSKMVAEKGLASGSVHIITENSVVYLMGIVTPEQADLAVNVARHVNGVSKVVKVFQYIR